MVDAGDSTARAGPPPLSWTTRTAGTGSSPGQGTSPLAPRSEARYTWGSGRGYEPVTPPGLLAVGADSTLGQSGFQVLTEQALALVCWSSGLSCQNLGPSQLGPILEADLVEAFRRGVVRQGPGGRALLQESEESFVSLQDKALELVAWQAGKNTRLLGDYPECGPPEARVVALRVAAFRQGLLLQSRPS